MGKFSSQEIESQYNLIKMLLAEPEKYKDAIDAIKKDIAYMPMELKKKTWRRKYYLLNETFTHSYKQMTHMYGIAITYGVVSLLLLGGFAYLTFKMTSKKWKSVIYAIKRMKSIIELNL